MTRVFCDFHHSSLLRSLHLLFDERLHMMLYRPIGMEWFDEGFWAINDSPETAAQFLNVEQAAPRDGTPLLNKLSLERDEALGETDSDGVYYVLDPGGQSYHRAATLEFFKNNRFDYVIASIPAHVPIFKELIAKYQPQAKLIIQMGNNWNLEQYSNENILASIAPQPGGYQNNIMFYHQEFDRDIFRPAPVPTQPANRKVYSFLNIIQNSGIGWDDYSQLKEILERKGWEFRAYGGQCPDGNMNGPIELADKMREAMFVFHVKPGGDGFGHIIHNAYACGRPVITRSSHYKGQLAEQLLVPGTFIDLDQHSIGDIKNMLVRLSYDPTGLMAMGQRAAEQFNKVIDYNKESEEIKLWLTNL